VASFCKAPPTAEQLQQQQQEDGQKSKQQGWEDNDEGLSWKD
jgi:hypothetical protein